MSIDIFRVQVSTITVFVRIYIRYIFLSEHSLKTIIQGCIKQTVTDHHTESGGNTKWNSKKYKGVPQKEHMGTGLLLQQMVAIAILKKYAVSWEILWKGS
jgi:hypothetical protein